LLSKRGQARSASECARSSRGGERIPSSRDGESHVATDRIRRWMHTKELKEKEREKAKQRMLQKERLWIESVVLKQVSRNRENRQQEETDREAAALVIQACFPKPKNP